MPQDDPECSPPPDGYQEGLESYLFLPLQEEIITLLQESKNSTTGNLWFSHVSSWFVHPQMLITDKQFPAVFVLVPSATIQVHGMKQLALNITLQFEYYCKHYKRNVTNELPHFVERLLYIIQTHPSITFGKLGLCAKKIAMEDATITSLKNLGTVDIAKLIEELEKIKAEKGN